ncbi:LPS export ABC transporter periplasmic protein LptC [Oricola sp.]|uniref:LPS export ABC transporter periplasmic protein LptC n=1 Tax=Oricola sp. TaxID=1979950 RepID=UPI003BAAF701
MTAIPDQTRQDAFRAARSHSSRVRMAKLLLPVIGVVALLVAGGYMWASRTFQNIAIDIAGSAIKDGKLVMSNPKLDGFTVDNRPYSVRAARAIQNITGGVIDLERIEALVPMDGGIDVRISAPGGSYDTNKSTLDMNGAFYVETSDGMRADLVSAAIDMKAGSLATPDPVRISMPGAVIQAERLNVTDRGKRMVFEDSVKLVVEPSVFRDSASDDAPGADTDS